jgi:hypothetical protein
MSATLLILVAVALVGLALLSTIGMPTWWR